MTLEEYNKTVEVIARRNYEIGILVSLAIDDSEITEEKRQFLLDGEFEKEFDKNVKGALNEEYWKDGKHFGDCTSEPNTCMRCFYEECIDVAERMLDNIGIKKPSE